MSGQEPSDVELVERARSGSLASFEQLVRRHENRLFRFLLARCHCRADAEDALQESFAAAYRYLGSYRPRWAFSTWLYRIAQRQMGRIVGRRTVPADPLLLAGDPTVDDAAARQRQSQIWAVAREVLPDIQATALWLHYAEDLPVKEIARVLDRPETWIKVNLYRARQRLARELDPATLWEQEAEIGHQALGEME